MLKVGTKAKKSPPAGGENEKPAEAHEKLQKPVNREQKNGSLLV